MSETSSRFRYIDYIDVFGHKSSCVFSVTKTGDHDYDDLPILEINEVLKNGDVISHSGEPFYGYDYAKSEKRDKLLSQLDKEESSGV